MRAFRQYGVGLRGWSWACVGMVGRDTGDAARLHRPRVAVEREGWEEGTEYWRGGGRGGGGEGEGAVGEASFDAPQPCVYPCPLMRAGLSLRRAEEKHLPAPRLTPTSNYGGKLESTFDELQAGTMIHCGEGRRCKLVLRWRCDGRARRRHRAEVRRASLRFRKVGREGTAHAEGGVPVGDDITLDRRHSHAHWRLVLVLPMTSWTLGYLC
ncbi:hypothetical protein B0H14DRAFT_2756718 [Mycena olivaceomarginata]|nr:hypothetical protein B0H14DRAFT_2756718 [Mycena olivaceomarginata]